MRDVEIRHAIVMQAFNLLYVIMLRVSTDLQKWTFLKRPPKTPDKAYPVAKNQEYACVYDWNDRTS